MPFVRTPDCCPKCAHRTIVFLEIDQAGCQRCGHTWPTPEAATLGDLASGDAFEFIITGRELPCGPYRLAQFVAGDIAFVRRLPDDDPTVQPIVAVRSMTVRRVDIDDAETKGGDE